jgi:acetyltransferase
MTIRNLEYAMSPRPSSSLARPGALARSLALSSTTSSAALSKGRIWPVNAKHPQVAGHRCYGRVADLPDVPDLVVIVTPPGTVPGIVRELAEKGTRAKAKTLSPARTFEPINARSW